MAYVKNCVEASYSVNAQLTTGEIWMMLPFSNLAFEMFHLPFSYTQVEINFFNDCLKTQATEDQLFKIG